MEWLGELERAFASSLYPLRIPIAIGLTIAVVALALFARRRGWLAAALTPAEIRVTGSTWARRLDRQATLIRLVRR